MFRILIDYMLGPLGRAIEAAYLNHMFAASLIVLGWMIVVLIGMRNVYRMRQQLREWIKEMLPQYDPEDMHTPERLLLALETRWNEAAAQVRFMPTKHGLWLQYATPEGLRKLAGFTPEGIEQVIVRITGHTRRDINIVVTNASHRTAHPKRRKHSTRARHKQRV